MENITTKLITETHEYPCNKYDTLSEINKEDSISTGTISLIDKYLQNTRIVLIRCSITYTKVHPCNRYAT